VLAAKSAVVGIPLAICRRRGALTTCARAAARRRIAADWLVSGPPRLPEWQPTIERRFTGCHGQSGHGLPSARAAPGTAIALKAPTEGPISASTTTDRLPDERAYSPACGGRFHPSGPHGSGSNLASKWAMRCQLQSLWRLRLCSSGEGPVSSAENPDLAIGEGAGDGAVMPPGGLGSNTCKSLIKNDVTQRY